MNDMNGNEMKKEAPGTRPTGGLYARVKMSMRTANIIVASLITVLVLASAFLISHNGFTVSFDTDGGSHVDSVRVMHSDVLSLDCDPVKEGFTFTGWYTDRDCTNEWDMSTDAVTGSMTLYAGWSKNK